MTATSKPPLRRGVILRLRRNCNQSPLRTTPNERRPREHVILGAGMVVKTHPGGWLTAPFSAHIKTHIQTPFRKPKETPPTGGRESGPRPASELRSLHHQHMQRSEHARGPPSVFRGYKIHRSAPLPPLALAPFPI